MFSDNGVEKDKKCFMYCGDENCNCGLSNKIMNLDISHPKGFDLIEHLYRQIEFSLTTFGPGPRTEGVLDHLHKELVEVEAEPNDLEEWIDLVMLALDGAWRAGFTPQQIAAQLEAKQTKNELREWPDWRTAEQGKAIEHVRGID